MSEATTITVTWGGREQTLTLLGRAALGARMGAVALYKGLFSASPPWIAQVEVTRARGVFVYCGTEEPSDDCRLRGGGNTPQEALDDLAAQLRALAAWATGMLEGKES